MFHIFHKYGKLAQISIKQAYGFIQFLEASSCHRSLQAEQGAVIRGRKIREFHIPTSTPGSSPLTAIRSRDFQTAEEYETGPSAARAIPRAPSETLTVPGFWKRRPQWSQRSPSTETAI